MPNYTTDLFNRKFFFIVLYGAIAPCANQADQRWPHARPRPHRRAIQSRLHRHEPR